MQAVAGEIGAGRTGVRLSPMTTFNDTPRDSDPQSLYEYVLSELSPMRLAYLHMIEGETGGSRHPVDPPALDYTALQTCYGGHWMVNNGYGLDDACVALETGQADLVAFGRAFISNPDLVRRLREKAALNPLRPDTLYGGGAEGYIDYPLLAPAGADGLTR